MPQTFLVPPEASTLRRRSSTQNLHRPRGTQVDLECQAERQFSLVQVVYDPDLEQGQSYMGRAVLWINLARVVMHD